MIFLKRVKNLFKKKRSGIHTTALKCDDAVNASLKHEVVKRRQELLDLIRLLDTL
jgi:hypothetical protein